MTTFQHQDTLQKLPIPDLKDTCAKYLSFVKPLTTEKEYSETKSAVNEFLNGVGPVLDEHLREYAKTRNSYIEQFWYDSYLNYDSPVVLNLNPFFMLEDDPFPNGSSNPQIKRASNLTLSTLKFIRSLRREELAPDMVRNQALCMYQYTKLFGSSRIPTETGCVMQSDLKSQHIIVLSKSQFYWFDVLDDNNDIILSESDLINNFDNILNDSLQTPIEQIAKSSFGVLTTENRRVWSGLRNHLSRNAINDQIIKIIDSALFVVCLDDLELDSLPELSKNMLCGLSILDKGVQVGTCTNRWYDKIQIIVTKNGKAGINFEHTGVDGHTVLRYMSDIYTDSILNFAKTINPSSPSIWKTTSPNPDSRTTSSKVVTIPRKLEWDLTPELSLNLRFAETRLSDLISQNEFKCMDFKKYGANKIKKMGFSPDAFIQMSFQVTYYALYGRVESTYEPAMTKKYFHGRTEAIRTVSEESNLFVRKFFENIPSDEKIKYLKDACNSHTKQSRDAGNGLGVDRHLFALFSIWKRYIDDMPEETARRSSNSSDSDSTIVGADDRIPRDIPSIFADKGWDKLNTTIISTSNCGNPSLRMFGFGPVSANGFGIGYIIKDESVTLCVSSKYRQTERFLSTLENYLVEIESIHKESLNMVPKPSDSSVSLKSELEVRSRKLTYLLGGYGYFDVGDDEIKSRGNSPEPPFNRRLKDGFTEREIGKKLRLSEY